MGATLLLSSVLAACAGDIATAPRQAPPARDGEAVANRTESAVPIVGTCVSQDAQPPVLAFPFLSQVITGTCEFSHLGRTRMSLLQRVDVRTGTSVGQATFTARLGSC